MVTEGKFGYSFAYRKDVGELMAERAAQDPAAGVLAHLISTVVGVGLGIFVAPRKYGFWDNLASVLAFIFTSVPRFSWPLLFCMCWCLHLKQPSIVVFFFARICICSLELGQGHDMFKQSGR